MRSLAVASEGKVGKVGDGTLEEEEEEEGEYGTGRPVLLSLVAFFLTAVVDGAGEREQRMSREGAGDVVGGSRTSRAGAGEREQRMLREGVGCRGPLPPDAREARSGSNHSIQRFD